MAWNGGLAKRPILEEIQAGACPRESFGACAAIGPPQRAARRYDRWESAISRLQAVLSCSPECPFAEQLLKVVADIGRDENPLAEVCPELDPAPRKTSHPWLKRACA